jgi:hypothetical protein
VKSASAEPELVHPVGLAVPVASPSKLALSKTGGAPLACACCDTSIPKASAMNDPMNLDFIDQCPFVVTSPCASPAAPNAVLIDLEQSHIRTITSPDFEQSHHQAYELRDE